MCRWVVVVVGLVGLWGLGLVSGSVAGESASVPDHWMVAGGLGGCSSVTAVEGDLRDLKRSEWGQA